MIIGTSSAATSAVFADHVNPGKVAAYEALGSIRFEGMFHRSDIGARGLALAAASEGE